MGGLLFKERLQSATFIRIGEISDSGTGISTSIQLFLAGSMAEYERGKHCSIGVVAVSVIRLKAKDDHSIPAC